MVGGLPSLSSATQSPLHWHSVRQAPPPASHWAPTFTRQALQLSHVYRSRAASTLVVGRPSDSNDPIRLRAEPLGKTTVWIRYGDLHVRVV